MGVLYRKDNGVGREVDFGSPQHIALEGNPLWHKVDRSVKSVGSPLTAIKGVGEAIAKSLEEAGYKTVEDVANSTAEKVADGGNIALSKAKSIIKEANG